jgi:succinoglycan biosynthesis protein ExoM
MTKVSVCICTYKRETLKETIDSLYAQDYKGSNVELEIIVIDNDSNGFAKNIVEDYENIKYYIEKRKNISVARNMSIQMATGEYVLFIDDDEVAEKHLLINMLECMAHYNADVVTGLVKPIYPEGTKKWVINGGYFVRTLPETGSMMNKAITGNSLVKVDIIKNILFDVSLGKTGGEDTKFFKEIVESGGKIICCNEAVVSEYVEPNRVNLNYITKRAIRIGETFVVVFFSDVNGLKRIKYFFLWSFYTLVFFFLVFLSFPFGIKKISKFHLKMLMNFGKVRSLLKISAVKLYE